MQPGVNQSPQNRYFHNPKFTPGFQKTPGVGFYPNTPRFSHNAQANSQAQGIEFDGKRLRKAVARKTVDYNSAVVKYLECRTWQRDYRDRRAVQPDVGYYTEIMPPLSSLHNPVNAITTKFVRTSTNKMRCPIFCVVWTPEGRRLITGASSGEFTLWNGLTFNFETILQAHDSPVRCMVWSHNDIWMVTGDHSGYVKYWQSNMNNVKMFQAHKEPLRGISFCPTDTKFVTCSDDGTVRIWDFLRCHEEKILRGHGADVKCVAWHPQKSLIVSGSKDSQQPIKLWDPKSGQSLATLHAHKSTVMEVKWNANGTWMLTASRDHLLKLFDIRNMSQEVQTFRGHKKEACSIAWHPIHESMFVSGGSDGSVMFWVVGADKEVGAMEQAHDSCVWSLAWHPLGHILCTGSNDHTSKFWTRNRPGDRMRDKYNLNTLPRGQDETAEYDEPSIGLVIPGMGMEYSFQDDPSENADSEAVPNIPGLDFGMPESTKADSALNQQHQLPNFRKVPFSKPIPRQFQQQWMESKQPLLIAPPLNIGAPPPVTVPPPQNVGAPQAPPSTANPSNLMPPPMAPPPIQGDINGTNQRMPPPPNFSGPPPPMGQPFPGGPPMFNINIRPPGQPDKPPLHHRPPLLGDRPIPGGIGKPTMVAVEETKEKHDNLPDNMKGPPNTQMGPPPNSQMGPPPNSQMGPPPNSQFGGGQMHPGPRFRPMQPPTNFGHENKQQNEGDWKENRNLGIDSKNHHMGPPLGLGSSLGTGFHHNMQPQNQQFHQPMDNRFQRHDFNDGVNPGFGGRGGGGMAMRGGMGGGGGNNMAYQNQDMRFSAGPNQENDMRMNETENKSSDFNNDFHNDFSSGSNNSDSAMMRKRQWDDGPGGGNDGMGSGFQQQNQQQSGGQPPTHLQNFPNMHGGGGFMHPMGPRPGGPQRGRPFRGLFRGNRGFQN